MPLCPFPPLYWWSEAAASSARLHVSEHYQKRSFRNRFSLMTANGPQSLTLPVERRAGRPRPQEETMRSPGDELKLWRAVRTAYGAAPFFEELAPELEVLFLDGPRSLGAWNQAALAWASGWLGVSVPRHQTEPVEVVPNHMENMERWSMAWADSHIGWVHIWSDRGLEIPFAKLSCLDAVLHCGPEAKRWISPL